jgi:hypothetical protein
MFCVVFGVLRCLRKNTSKSITFKLQKKIQYFVGQMGLSASGKELERISKGLEHIHAIELTAR